MTDIFCELLSVKEPQTTLQNKETTVPCYRKMSNQNTKKSPGIEFALFNCTGEMRMDNFVYLSSSLYFMAYIGLQMNLPLPPIRASTLLIGLWRYNIKPSLLASERTYVMDDHLHSLIPHFT